MADELWGRCPQCREWFVVVDPKLDAYYRCPVCLLTGDRFERRPDDSDDDSDDVADGAA